MGTPTTTRATAPILDLAACISCGARLGGEPACPRCGRGYPIRDGILGAIEPLSGRNRIVADFYDGPGWRRFHPWEQAFLLLQGGVRRARMPILRHVLRVARPDVVGLEVGIGDGENLAFLPPEWTVHGVDVATRLEACIAHHPRMAGRLAWAEAERLPFDDATFDACWTIGGFTYFGDHEAALREMRRVTRPGGPIVVADEVTGLHRAGLGHLIGRPALDVWWLGLLGLDRPFAEMVFSYRENPAEIIRHSWPEAVHHRIWYGMGYCFLTFA